MIPFLVYHLTLKLAKFLMIILYYQKRILRERKLIKILHFILVKIDFCVRSAIILMADMDDEWLIDT